MKKIYLLGDSIRLGYDGYVKDAFEGVAGVVYPADNCRFASYLYRNVHLWADDLGLAEGGEVAAVHFNAGLWDTVRLLGDGCFTPPDVYRDYLIKIASRLRALFPTAKLIFATSTPVDESGYIPDFEMRYNRDIEEYNRVAIEALTPLGVTVNDLYSLMKDHPECHSDQTHYYTEEGARLLGGAVVGALCDALGTDKSSLSLPDAKKFVREGLGRDCDLYEKRGTLYVLKDEWRNP